MTEDDWQSLLREIPLPAVVVDLDAFDQNLRLLTQPVAGTSLSVRLATKSVRVPALIRRVIDSGAPLRGLMSYAASESSFLADQGFDDLLIAYPLGQPSDLDQLRALHERGVTIRQVVDSVEQAAAIDQAMAGVDRPVELVLDIDLSLRMVGGRVHLGVRRSPVREIDQAVEFFRQVARMANVRCRSVMGYEAQVAGLADRNPFKRSMHPILGWVRSRSMRQIADHRRRLRDVLAREGFELELFNGGGSGSVNMTAREPWLTELTIGSGLLCSHLFSYYSNIHPRPACYFALRVTRSSDPGYVTCAGGGYIASGEPGWDRVPIPAIPAGLRLVSMEGCGEVQTPLIVPPQVRLSAGDAVLFRHSKAGELAEHFNRYFLVQGGRVVDEVPTYRGLGCCFLG